MKKRITPSSIDGIKRLARAIKVELATSHANALDTAAKVAGFQNYAHARRVLGDSMAAGASNHRSSDGRPRVRTPFHEAARARWVCAVETVAPTPKLSTTWQEITAIVGALEPFMGENNNHAHLPTGGGWDGFGVGLAHETGCIEFAVSERVAYIMKPRVLTLERIDLELAESFLLLELDELPPSGAYGDNDSKRGSEEAVEIAPGEYVDRSVWDDGYLGIDDRGREIPIYESAQLVVRLLRGKILLVTKGSLWNSAPATCDGRHDKMTAAEIRDAIERTLQSRR